METRRLFTALMLGLAVFLVYRIVYDRLVPPPERPAESAAPAVTQPDETPALPTTKPDERAAAAPTTAQTAPADSLSFSQAEQEASFTLGGSAQDMLQIELTSRGAAVSRILLAEQKDEKYVHRLDEDTNEPYVLLKPVEDPSSGEAHRSYLTRQISLGKQEFPLNHLRWEVAQQDSHKAVFTTTLPGAGGVGDRLRITKTYVLEPGSALTQLQLKVENLSDSLLDQSLRLHRLDPVAHQQAPLLRGHLEYPDIR